MRTSGKKYRDLDRRHAGQDGLQYAWIRQDGSTLIGYGMDKSPEQEWNVVIGGQFQLNKRWQLGTEGGIIGDRKSFLISANYRLRI
jgi:hypothetical protein